MKDLGDGVYQLRSPSPMSNAYLVRANGWVLIDAGTRGADAVREATGAVVCAAATERPMLSGALWSEIGLARRLMLRARHPRGLPPAPTVDSWLEAGDEIAGVRVVATPGHTPGHTSYVLGRTLIAGDAVVTARRCHESLRAFTMDRAAARRSIEALAELDIDLAVSGHGRPARDPRAKLERLATTWRG